MKRKPAKKARTRQAKPREIRAAFTELRIQWIDRLVRALEAYPGAPPYSEVAKTCNQLRRQLQDYRDGFVHARNVMRGHR